MLLSKHAAYIFMKGDNSIIELRFAQGLFLFQGFCMGVSFHLFSFDRALQSYLFGLAFQL